MLWRLFIAVYLLDAVLAQNDPIPGPKYWNDSIVIVGGDFAGIHMAYLLKKTGFSNIHIYESENRLGGNAVYNTGHRG